MVIKMESYYLQCIPLNFKLTLLIFSRLITVKLVLILEFNFTWMNLGFTIQQLMNIKLKIFISVNVKQSNLNVHRAKMMIIFNVIIAKILFQSLKTISVYITVKIKGQICYKLCFIKIPLILLQFRILQERLRYKIQRLHQVTLFNFIIYQWFSMVSMINIYN